MTRPQARRPGLLDGWSTLIRTDIRRIQADNGTWIRDLTVDLPVKAGTGFSASGFPALRQHLQDLLDTHLNTGYRLPRSGDQLHIEVRLTPAADSNPYAVQVSVSPEPGRFDQLNFPLHPPTAAPAQRAGQDAALLHEVLHYTGLSDRYHDSEALFRRGPGRGEATGVMAEVGVLPQGRFPLEYLAQIEDTTDSGPVIYDHPLPTASSTSTTSASSSSAPVGMRAVGGGATVRPGHGDAVAYGDAVAAYGDAVAYSDAVAYGDAVAYSDAVAYGDGPVHEPSRAPVWEAGQASGTQASGEPRPGQGIGEPAGHRPHPGPPPGSSSFAAGPVTHLPDTGGTAVPDRTAAYQEQDPSAVGMALTGGPQGTLHPSGHGQLPYRRVELPGTGHTLLFHTPTGWQGFAGVATDHHRTPVPGTVLRPDSTGQHLLLALPVPQAPGAVASWAFPLHTPAHPHARLVPLTGELPGPLRGRYVHTSYDPASTGGYGAVHRLTDHQADGRTDGRTAPATPAVARPLPPSLAGHLPDGFTVTGPTGSPDGAGHFDAWGRLHYHDTPTAAGVTFRRNTRAPDLPLQLLLAAELMPHWPRHAPAGHHFFPAGDGLWGRATGYPGDASTPATWALDLLDVQGQPVRDHGLLFDGSQLLLTDFTDFTGRPQPLPSGPAAPAIPAAPAASAASAAPAASAASAAPAALQPPPPPRPPRYPQPPRPPGYLRGPVPRLPACSPRSVRPPLRGLLACSLKPVRPLWCRLRGRWIPRIWSLISSRTIPLGPTVRGLRRGSRVSRLPTWGRSLPLLPPVRTPHCRTPGQAARLPA